MSELSGIKFRPVMGPQSIIENTVQSNGYLYVATDSGNMYLDVDNHRIAIGGVGGSGSSSSFVWADGNDENITKATDDDSDFTYLIDISALEVAVMPKPDVLILNSDGRFFRVLSIDENDKIVAELIAVSGSGGGGGGGGGGSIAERDVNIEWDNRTITTGSTYVFGQLYNAVFTPTTTAPGDTDCIVTFNILDREHDTKTSITQTGRSGQKMNFNMGQLPKSTNITLQVVVTSPNAQYNDGLGYQRNITGLKVVTMELKKPEGASYLPLIKPDDISGTLAFGYQANGQKDNSGNALIPITVHVYSDDIELTGLKSIVPASYYGRTVTVDVPRQTHGVHKISFKLSTTINGVDLYTDEISYEGAWASDNDDTPIIWIGKYDQTIVNYENSYVYYMVFDPINYRNGLPAEVHLYKDNVEVSQINATYSDENWLNWDISNLYEIDEAIEETKVNNFSISCRTVKVDIPITVTTVGSRSLGLIKSGMLLNITSAGRSSTEISSQRSVLKSTVNPDQIIATLTNFNWQNNGWRDSEGLDSKGVDSGSYLAIANDAALSINMLGSGLSINSNKSYTFEMRFRVRNVQAYSTLIKTVPKYFYDMPNTEEGHEDEWIPTYILTIVNDEEVASAKPGYTSLYEWEIKERGYRIGVDKYGNLLMDEENTVKEEDTSSGVVVRWLNPAGLGFCIGTQEAFFKTPSGIANVRYCEDEVINLSMVLSTTDKLCYLYLNGILSGVTPLPTGSGSSFIINTPFEFNSNYCDFDLYRFRVYESGLTMPNVIHNYLSDMHSINLYDQNQLTDDLDPTALDYNLLVSYNAKNIQDNKPEALSMPYATWQITDGTDELLPWKKGNNRACTVEFVNPALDYALENGDIDEWYYYTHSPSFVANNVDINVQGTSTQKYPRRNYKTKFKDAKKTWVFTKGSLAGQPIADDHEVTDKNGATHTLVGKFHMDVEDYGVNKFTWKIDYMESSGSYNAGFANLMGNLSHPLYRKHPLDDLNLGIETENMRTSVYGFPVLTFHKYADGSYEYVGKYAMNLDKSANEAYGFELKNKQPYVAERQRQVLNEETNTYETETYQPTIKEIAECWEMKDNQGNWCSFKYPDATSRATGFRTLKEGTSGDTAQLEILNHYEYRYNFQEDELDAAYKYSTFTDSNTQVEYTNNGQINDWLYNKHKNLEDLFIWLDSTDVNTATNDNLSAPVTYNVSSTVDNDDSITYTLISSGLWSAEFTKDTKEYRRQKFRAEFSEHLDLEYCLTYFVLTELLLCYDSRGKNMMMATWGPHRPGGSYIWYPLFYDIDTQLGLNNSGAYLWDYDADVTKDNLFSTPTSVLWTNLYDLFYSDIVNKYRVLRGVSEPSSADARINGSLTEKNIVGAYEYDATVFDSYAMRGVRPIIAVGLDEYYKYLAPALKAADYNNGKKYAGYYDTSGAHLYQDTPTYAYCAQGDKKLTTELLIRNRLNYIDSWWLGGDYRAGVVENQIFIRANANHSSTSDLFLDDDILDTLPAAAQGKGFSLRVYPVDRFDARPGAKIKPFLHQYVSYFMDSQPSVPVKYDGGTGQEDGVWTNVDAAKLQAFKIEPDLSQQITYIPGGDYISSLGDISLMYPNSLQIFHGQRLLDLKIGSDASGYKNPLLTRSSDWELTAMPLLKSVNVSNLSQFNREMNLTASAKLQEFRALGSIIERVNFAAGAPLKTVHLPNTMTTVSFVQNKNLNKILTAKPVDATSQDYVNTEGLYIEGVTDYTSTNAGTGHKLETYEVNGGGLGYNSYKILKNLYDLKYGASTNQNLAVSLIDVEWTPYQLVEIGTPYSSNQTYYLLNDHSTFEPFVFSTAQDWNNKLLNEVIYIYNPAYTKYNPSDSATANAEERTIQDLSLLDNFIAAYNLAEAAHTASQFANTSGSTSATVPTITGTMYVSNDANNKIDESLLTSKYKEKFPNLTIHVANVQEANIAKYVRVYDNGKIETIAMERTSGNQPILPSAAAPTQTYYDFAGWSLDNPNTVAEPALALEYNLATASYTTTSIWNNLRFGQDTIMTFYAIFVPHVYEITFKYSDGTTIATTRTPYNTPIVLPSVMPYQDESALPLTSKYAFIGWSYAPDSITTLSMATTLATKDTTFYAVFEESSVYENPIDEAYLQLQLIEQSDANGVSVTGWMLGLNPAYSFRGKITLPSWITDKTTGTAYPVTVIKDGSSNANDEQQNGISNDGGLIQDPNNPAQMIAKGGITHIFFDTQSGTPSLMYINGLAFYGCTKLKYVDIPASCFNIGQQAFAFSAVEFSSISAKVIAGACFNGCTHLAETFTINASVETIYYSGFQGCSSIKHLNIGAANDPSRLQLVGDSMTSRMSSLQDITIYTDRPDAEVWQSEGLRMIVTPHIVEV